VYRKGSRRRYGKPTRRHLMADRHTRLRSRTRGRRRHSVCRDSHRSGSTRRHRRLAHDIANDQPSRPPAQYLVSGRVFRHPHPSCRLLQTRWHAAKSIRRGPTGAELERLAAGKSARMRHCSCRRAPWPTWRLITRGCRGGERSPSRRPTSTIPKAALSRFWPTSCRDRSRASGSSSRFFNRASGIVASSHGSVVKSDAFLFQQAPLNGVAAVAGLRVAGRGRSVIVGT
jgi:hypothetical protein